MHETLDFGAVFKQLAANGAPEHQTVLGGVDIRLVRLAGGTVGRWDRHDDTAETVIVWSGTFEVAYRDGRISLGAGQSCVVPVGVEHQGSSPTGAEVILFKTAPTA